MSKRVTRGWLVRAGIASAVGAAAIFAAVTMGAFGSHSANAATGFIMDTSGGGSAAIGSNVVVNVDLTNNDPVNQTWGGWNTHVLWNDSVVNFVSVASGGLCSGTWGNQAPTAGSDKAACAFATGTASSPPPTEVFTFKCVGPGSTGVALDVDTVVFDPNAVNYPTALGPFATITCNMPITKTANVSGTVPTGTPVQYTITVSNPTNATVSIPGVLDNVPAALTGVAINSIVSPSSGANDGCSVVGNQVQCVSAEAGANASFILKIDATIPDSAQGTTGVCNTAQENPPNGPSTSAVCFDVAPTNLVVTKVANATSYKAGDTISWTITVANTGASQATNVNVSDTATDGFDITGTTGSANCTAGAFSATAAAWSCGTLTSVDGVQTLTVTGTVHTPNPTDLSCNNSVSATSDNATTATASASTSCLSKNVRMVKDTDGNLNESSELANLWLCKGVTCTGNGQGSLVVDEWALNFSGDPQGLGAYEFQVKYDNHIFDISIADTGYLYSTGRVPGDTGIGGCAATIITENDIRFGCVSKNPQPLAPQTGCLGPDNVTMVTTAICGVKADGILAKITVTPKADLVNRITPGNDNGAIRTLLDEGCELADIWGHPLSAAPDPSGVDALGREIPLGGIAPGGQVTDCADITITVRILEGDMNVDCVVDVADDQTEASHYGAFFGSLLYQPWYDLEPALKDGDVDIKDLQKVFGRNGSTCANPVPPQPALPEPVDP